MIQLPAMKRSWLLPLFVLSSSLLGPLPARCQNLGDLLRGLRNSEFAVRADAARKIGDLGQAGAGTLASLDKLLYDQASPVRQAAAGAMARISGPQATKYLLTALGNEVAEVRRDVTQGLQEAPDRNLRLLNQAILDSDTQTREHAVVALSKGTNQAILPLLAQAAGTDEDAFVRERAMEGLRDWVQRPRPTGTPAAPPQVVEVVRKGLEDRSDRVRTSAVRTMAVLDPYRTVSLVETMIDDRSEEVREAIFETLGQIGGPRGVSVLQKALSHRQLAVRKDAVRALAKVGVVGVAGLVRGLQDSSREVRTLALEALPRPIPEQALGAVVGLAQDREVSLRVGLMEALAQDPRPGRPQARRTVRASLRDPAPEVRRAAVAAAAALWDKGVVDILEEVATDSDLVVFQAKLEAIAAPGTSRSAVVLAGLLSDRQAGSFREQILELILDMPKFAAGALVSVLQSGPDAALEQRLVEILGGLGDPRPAPDLLAILEDEEASDQLRIAAAKSLAELRHAEALSAMESFWVGGKHLPPDQSQELFRAIQSLGGSGQLLLSLRRHLFPLLVVLGFFGSLVAWHRVLKPRLTTQMEEKESERLKNLEAKAKEPERIPTEDEFLAQLDEKLAGEPARPRKIRYMIQRGLLHYVKLSFAQAATDLGQVTRLFNDEDDANAKARVYFFLGKAALNQGDKQTAQRRLSDALRHHDKRLLSDVMSEIAQDPGDIDGGIAKLEEHLPFDDDINVVDIQKLRLF